MGGRVDDWTGERYDGRMDGRSDGGSTGRENRGAARQRTTERKDGQATGRQNDWAGERSSCRTAGQDID